MGKLLMYAAYEKDLHVTWFPSYGNEMIGGNANCKPFTLEEFEAAMSNYFDSQGKGKYNESNKRAIEAGYNA